ncbi:MAG: pentapeptide repeat-containing protein [Planctomycetota bacterium]|nr:pentapeptide repeat-containing protein [Planctomycetota bacterium]MDG1984536.1 pentapeptide repeat-containing protein [Planctomycetota bacterium]
MLNPPETQAPASPHLMHTDALGRAAAARQTLTAIRAGEVPGAGADFSGLALIGEDLSGLDLRSANFDGADLSRCNMKGANLFGAQLEGTTLFETDLTGAELSGANLKGANLGSAKLDHAGLGMSNLTGACLALATMESATLTEADLTGADLRLAKMAGARAIDTRFRDACLTKADCTEAELSGADVTGATLDGACLRASSLTGLRGFKQASWIGVDLRDIDFTGAYLCRRFANDQNFIEEFRTQSKWTQFVYHLWSVTSDCGRSVTRWAACTAAIVLAFALLYTTVGISYGDHETWLSPLYFSVVTMTTLGYGDVLPASAMGQVVAMCQVITGYVMLGGLLSIFSNKMSSRAD